MIQILAPLTGTAVPLETVPDSAFSRKLLGGGAAILPEDGLLLSPVTGRVSAISHTLHAYVIGTPDGLEILVHVGLHSVGLQGRGFQPLVKEGDPVRAGDPVARIDLMLLRKKGVPLYTPVVVCEGAEAQAVTAVTGPVEAGKTLLLTVSA